MEYYILIKGTIIGANLNRQDAIKLANDYHKEHQEIDICRILMCYAIKREGKPDRYCKSIYTDFIDKNTTEIYRTLFSKN